MSSRDARAMFILNNGNGTQKVPQNSGHEGRRGWLIRQLPGRLQVRPSVQDGPDLDFPSLRPDDGTTRVSLLFPAQIPGFGTLAQIFFRYFFHEAVRIVPEPKKLAIRFR
jgi:hypothetical protein